MRARRMDPRALALVLLVGWAGMPPARGDSDALAGLNERWAGARCRIRLDLPIKKGRDGQGWSQSMTIFPRASMDLATASGGVNRAVMSVSDRDAVSLTISVQIPYVGRKSHQGVPRGTAFIAEGWEYQKQTGLVLNLRFARLPAHARMVFRGKRGGKLNRKMIEDVERWARLELFEVKAADERLVDVGPTTAPAAAASSAPPSPAAGVLPAQPPPISERATAELRVLGVAVEPLRAAPGSEIALVVTYSLTGAQAVEVLERRQILQGGEVLTTLEARILRQGGTHESRQPLQIPGDLAAGIYELRATVEGPGAAADGSTIFQVITDDQ